MNDTTPEIREHQKHQRRLFVAGAIPAKNAAPKATPEIPPRTREALDRYAAEHRPPGGFLEAVLENSSLTLPVLLADENSLKALRLIVRHCYSKLPPECWGSPEKVRAWLVVGEPHP